MPDRRLSDTRRRRSGCVSRARSRKLRSTPKHSVLLKLPLTRPGVSGFRKRSSPFPLPFSTPFSRRPPFPSEARRLRPLSTPQYAGGQFPAPFPHPFSALSHDAHPFSRRPASPACGRGPLPFPTLSQPLSHDAHLFPALSQHLSTPCVRVDESLSAVVKKSTCKLCSLSGHTASVCWMKRKEDQQEAGPASDSDYHSFADTE